MCSATLIVIMELKMLASHEILVHGFSYLKKSTLMREEMNE